VRVLGVIPARGGSKGIPGKNLVVVGGRPLICHTFDAARASRTLTRIVLSTDDEQIAQLGRAEGIEVPFIRPAALAADDTPMLDVLRHAIAAVGSRPEIVVLLQPTSPLRRSEHIDAAVSTLEESGADSVVSVVAVPHQFTPGSLLQLDAGRLVSLTGQATAARRQDKPVLYARNGPAVLVTRTTVLESGSLYGSDSRPFLMSREDSIDVDEPFDLEMVEAVLAHRRGHAALRGAPTV
jgi:CMP-N,N'-diacetyllegionaminic acid synthase